MLEAAKAGELSDWLGVRVEERQFCVDLKGPEGALYRGLERGVCSPVP
jgi:hypothetical protein